MKSPYCLQLMPKSFCPKCHGNVHLLCLEDGTPSAAFFICFHCKEVRQVGIGLVDLVEATTLEEAVG